MRAFLLALLLVTPLAMGGATYPPQSIYNYTAKLTDQDGHPQGLDAQQGHPVLITMFYGSCPMACPLLIDTLRAFESSLTPQERARVRVLMISIDPKRDTTESLRALADTRKLDLTRWTLMRTDDATVRKIAALLNVQYRQLPNGDFNHSSVITLLTPAGEIAARSSVLGKADEQLRASLSAL